MTRVRVYFDQCDVIISTDGDMGFDVVCTVMEFQPVF